ncbi:hypothetical protein [Glycocaulis alkaliphilus]|uniref:hypothetical protein n=1 Tax=Glycocaulis alkaliphilus TaxID=1434191 RepID=UPI000FD9BD13|nr:hypothetical protein [Glycocaulis alkaliphilus]GGB83096.1 hypothetical protein GCM10007417_23800 [Glycocaulis alkaliphilus]
MHEPLTVIGWLGDTALVAGGMITIIRALWGLHLEGKSQRCGDPDDSDKLEEDAKTLYALNTLQQPWMLLLLATGFICKAILLSWQAIAYLFGQ